MDLKGNTLNCGSLIVYDGTITIQNGTLVGGVTADYEASSIAIDGVTVQAGDKNALYVSTECEMEAALRDSVLISSNSCIVL